MTGRATVPDVEALLEHGDFVRAVARALLYDEHAAEDVAQETWMAALRAPTAVSRGWLGAVARNLAIKRLRGERRRSARESAAARPEGVPSDADVLERERLRRGVVDEVLALPEPYRATVLLRYFENLPPRDVARRMDVPVETARTRTRRAIEMLRVRIDGRRGDERDAFWGAIAVWAGPSRGGAGTAATGAGGLVMGTKTVVGCLIVAAGLATWLLWPRPVAAPPADATAKAPPPVSSNSSDGRPRTPGAAAARAPTEAPAAPEPTSSPKSPVVAGRVVDRDGRPAAGAVVQVMPRGSLGVRATADADGRFSVTLPSAETCVLAVVAAPALAPGDAARDVAPPAQDVVLVVDRKPTATLIVTALDPETGAPVADFTCDLGERDLVRKPRVAVDGKVDAVVRLASAAGDTVAVVAAKGPASGRRDVALRDGDRVEVRIDLQREGEVRGRVVDAAGRPVADALVFFGEEDVARGDEPFKPFDEKRVREGVRSDGDGRFELKGAGRWVTVWHADGGPVTVARGDAANVVLPARGVVRGILRGADGAPSANAKIFLDRVRETTTDGEGRFEFTGVEPGTRGLSLTGGKPKAYVAVRVTAGAAVDVEMRPGLPSVRIEWPGRTNLGRFVGLVPLDAVGSMAIGEPADGAVVAKDVLPGKYLLMGEGGALAVVDMTGATAKAVVGTGEIVVRAKPKTRLYVVPVGAGYLARLLGGRMAGPGVPAEGVKRFTGLAPGRYDVGVERDGVRATVEVKDGSVETAIE